MSGRRAYQLRTEDQFREAVQAEELTILYFCAEWCGPCQTIRKDFEKLPYAFPDCSFFKIDVDDLPDVVQQCGIRVLPTFLLVKAGENVGSLTGADIDLLKEFIKDAKEGNLEPETQHRR